jgi:hypothetical protein
VKKEKGKEVIDDWYVDPEEVKKVMNMYASGTYIEDIANYIGKSIRETNVIIDKYHSAFFY